MKTFVTLAALSAVIAVGAGTGWADSVTGGFNAGHGNPQNNFTVVSQNNVELGLSAQPRYNGPAVVQSGSTYYVQPGEAVPPGSSYNGALWNFDFSIETFNGLNLSDIVTTMSVTGPAGFNPSNLTFDPVHDFSDNAGGATVAQNSENLMFLPSAFDFNPNQPGTYTFTLTAANQTGGTLASDSINVSVVPLPSAAGMGVALLAVLGGAVALRRKFSVA